MKRLKVAGSVIMGNVLISGQLYFMVDFKTVDNKINNSKNIRIVISLCKLDIKHNTIIEKECVPSILPHVVKGYPYPHFFYFIR